MSILSNESKYLIDTLFENCKNKEEFETRFEAFLYSLKMFWLQRSDKLFADDYPLYISISNDCIGDKRNHLLAKNFRPTYNSEPLYKDQNYSELLDICSNVVRQYYTEKRPELFIVAKKSFWKLW